MPNLKKKQFLSSLKEILWPIERSELKLFIPMSFFDVVHIIQFWRITFDQR